MIRSNRLYRFIWLLAVAMMMLLTLASVSAQGTDNSGPHDCEPFLPPGWVTYAVQAGDTLSELALRSRVTMTQIQYMNCIRERSHIQVGQILFVPPTGVQVGEPANFALRCHDQGIAPQTCIRMMNMLGEENGDTLLIRCRNEGLPENECQWMMTQYQEAGGNGLIERCRSAGFDPATCYRMMLAIGQGDSDPGVTACLNDDSDVAECRWMMTHMHRRQVNVLPGTEMTSETSLSDQDRDRLQNRDQSCDQDCEPDQDRLHVQDQDQDRLQDRDQSCDQDCEPDQDRDRIGNGGPSDRGRGH